MPGGSTWAGEAIVTTCVIVSLLSLLFLHVNGIGAIDPLNDVISGYVFQPGGYALLGISALSMAVGTIVLATGLCTAGLPRPRLPFALLMSVAVAFVLVAVFPTHEVGTSAGLVSNVHRTAGGWIFAMLPLSACLIARRASSAPAWQPAVPALSWVSGFTGVLSAFYLLSYVPIVIGGLPGFPFTGAVQRVLYAAVMLVLVTTARATRLAVDRALVPAAVPSGDPHLRGAA